MQESYIYAGGPGWGLDLATQLQSTAGEKFIMCKSGVQYGKYWDKQVRLLTNSEAFFRLPLEGIVSAVTAPRYRKHVIVGDHVPAGCRRWGVGLVRGPGSAEASVGV